VGEGRKKRISKWARGERNELVSGRGIGIKVSGGERELEKKVSGFGWLVGMPFHFAVGYGLNDWSLFVAR
jgi:hypothetical protein